MGKKELREDKRTVCKGVNARGRLLTGTRRFGITKRAGMQLRELEVTLSLGTLKTRLSRALENAL